MNRPDDDVSIGARVRMRRKAAGLNQADLAERVGITSVHLSRIETGARSATLRLLRDLAVAFGCSVADLMQDAPTDRDDPSPSTSAPLVQESPPTSWEQIARSLADAMLKREETERLRVEKVDAVRAKAEQTMQDNIRIALAEASGRPHFPATRDEAATREEPVVAAGGGR